MLKKQNGITLIALIITIIVMLILVGVTINVALNGGLFTKAEEAKKGTEIASEKEQLLNAILGTLDNNGKIHLDQIILPEGFEEVSEDDSKIIYQGPSTNQYKVDKGNGEIEEVPENEKVTPTPPNEENDILGLYGNKATYAKEFLEDGKIIVYGENVAILDGEYEITGSNMVTTTMRTLDGGTETQNVTYEVIRDEETNEIINKILFEEMEIDGELVDIYMTNKGVAGINNSIYNNREFVSQENLYMYFHEGCYDFSDRYLTGHDYFVYGGYIWIDYGGVFYVKVFKINDDSTLTEVVDTCGKSGFDIFTEVK